MSCWTVILASQGSNEMQQGPWWGVYSGSEQAAALLASMFGKMRAAASQRCVAERVIWVAE
jgi:hypothetical protein